MAANRAQVTFTDGTVETVRLTPKATIAAEQRWGSTLSDHGAEASYWMAWFVLGMPGGANGFDAWLDTVEGIEAEPDPPAETATGSSATSPPSPRTTGSTRQRSKR